MNTNSDNFVFLLPVQNVYAFLYKQDLLEKGQIPWPYLDLSLSQQLISPQPLQTLSM